MGFHRRDKAFRTQRPSQPSPADVRHGQFRPGPALNVPVFIVAGIGELHQPAAVGGENGGDFIPYGPLETGGPVVPMHHNVRMVPFQILPVRERVLIHYPVYAADIFKHGFPLGGRRQRQPLIGGDRFIGQDADHQPAQFLRLFDNADVTAVDNVRGEAHIDDAVFQFAQFRGDHRQVRRIINFRAEKAPHVQRGDMTGPFQLIERVFRVNVPPSALAERGDVIQPRFPVPAPQFVQRLGRHRLMEKGDADFPYLPVPDDRFEIFFRQGKRGRNRHAGSLRRDHTVKHLIFKNQISVHENEVIVQSVSGEVDAVNIVRGRKVRVMHKRDVKRQAQPRAIVHKYTAERPGGNHDIPNTDAGKLAELTGKDGFPRGDFRHTFGMFRGQRAHAGAKTGI